MSSGIPFASRVRYPPAGSAPPWVESTGPGVQVLATVPRLTLAGRDAGPAAGKVVAVRQGGVLATAFHPELTGDLRLHALFCALVRQAAAAA